MISDYTAREILLSYSRLTSIYGDEECIRRIQESTLEEINNKVKESNNELVKR